MSEIARNRLEVQQMFDSIAPRYDFVNSIVSFGTHKGWRKALIKRLPRGNYQRALDLCCGTGDLLQLLNPLCATTIGADLSLSMLAVSQKRFSGKFSLFQADALKLPFAAEAFDLVTISFGVRNFEKLEEGLVEIYRILKPGGILLVSEFGQPPYKIFGSIYSWYSKYILPVIGGLLSGNPAAYRYLPRTAHEFVCGDQFNQLLRSVSFEPEPYQMHTFGIAYSYLAYKK